MAYYGSFRRILKYDAYGILVYGRAKEECASLGCKVSAVRFVRFVAGQVYLSLLTINRIRNSMGNVTARKGILLCSW